MLYNHVRHGGLLQGATRQNDLTILRLKSLDFFFHSHVYILNTIKLCYVFRFAFLLTVLTKFEMYQWVNHVSSVMHMKITEIGLYHNNL